MWYQGMNTGTKVIDVRIKEREITIASGAIIIEFVEGLGLQEQRDYRNSIS